MNQNILEISKTISPNDQMFAGNIKHYFSVSDSAIKCIETAINIRNRLHIVNDIKTILDLPCGHGRVLRSLKAYFPKAKITACDLNKDGVDFCVEIFNVEGIYSDNEISKIGISQKYDLIWCGSLLTHLNEKKSKMFLDFFISLLDNMGILVVSLHGRFSQTVQKGNSKYLDDKRFEGILKCYNKKGYGYADYEAQNYGISMLKPSWIFSYLEKKNDITIINYSERMWDKHQDVLALMKKPITVY
jgi:SAM-dependent methyltransferase